VAYATEDWNRRLRARSFNFQRSNFTWLLKTKTLIAIQSPVSRAAGAMHRGWVAVKTALVTYECERGRRPSYEASRIGLSVAMKALRFRRS
jgi:hypothetical protein